MLDTRPICRHVRLDGLVEYEACRELQRRLARDRRLGRIPDTLLILEHSPVVTIGRGGSRDGLLVPVEALQDRGIATCETERGGKVTYHGPGQLVGYPILDLGGLRRDVHCYLRQLEGVLIRALRDFGLSAERRDGLTGVWLSALPDGRRCGKVAAIGVAVRRWVTTHGFALNVCCDLAPFSLIDPCGLADLGVTSIAEALGRSVSLDDVRASVVRAFGETFGRDMVRAAL